MASNETKKTGFEKYEIIEISRAQVKNAPYNPRKITDEARKKLRDNIKRVGLLTPIVWNKKTGNIVSGHQRISALDSLEKSRDYVLRVACVDLDEKTEREQNIFFNNAKAQGEFDLEKLEVLYKDEDLKLDVASTGYDVADIYKTFGDSPALQQADELLEMSSKLREASERCEKIKEKTNARDEVNFYLVVVFPSDAARKEFTDARGLDDNRFVTPADIMRTEKRTKNS